MPVQTLNFELQTSEHAVFLLVVIAFDVNLYQSVIWLLMAKRNFYQSVPTFTGTLSQAEVFGHYIIMQNTELSQGHD